MRELGFCLRFTFCSSSPLQPRCIIPLPDHLSDSDACRIVIQLCTKNIPGRPGLRHIKVTNAFFQERCLRDFLPDLDYVHTPAQVDAHDAKCWVMINVNTRDRNGSSSHQREMPVRACAHARQEAAAQWQNGWTRRVDVGLVSCVTSGPKWLTFDILLDEGKARLPEG
jgi:hypothetical protein